MSTRAKLLIVLQAAFFCRVLGQILVLLVAPPWLPSLEHWMSGALPYHVLLPGQTLLLMWMTVITYDAVREDGYWHPTRQATRETLRVLAAVYFIAIVMRYVLTMAYLPELRWLGHAIPIAFHFVLASYLLVLGTDTSPGRDAAVAG